MKKNYSSKYEILKKAKEAKGLTFKSLDMNNRLNKGKGDLGQILEEGYFGYKINNVSEADFKEIGVELKVTPFIKGPRKTYAKERLVLGMIDFMHTHKETFLSSKFWSKNQSLLIVFYEYIKGMSKEELSVFDAILYEYPEDDLEIIKDDWKIIKQKISEGKAHELSEGDTMYLGACTKGSTSAKSMKPQVNSDKLARGRAYCLKQSYMTYIVNEYLLGKSDSEQIIKDFNLLKKTTFEEYVINTVERHYGKTQKDLMSEFKIESTAKNINELIVARMFGVKGKLAQTEEFLKAGISPKTIRLSVNGDNIRESMSFPTFKFTEIIDENWDDSTLKNRFEQMKYLFIIFQFDTNGELVFRRIKFWNMPDSDFSEVEKVWTRTVNTIKEGVVLLPTSRGISNNLPKESESRVAHVRPHGRNAQDTYPLPDGRLMTKQCFWLNRKYVVSQITE